MTNEGSGWQELAACPPFLIETNVDT